MIKEDMLDAFSDEDIRSIQSLGNRVLKQRDDGRKAEATEAARVALAAVGLTFKDVLKTKPKPVKGPQYKGGHTYQHPTDKTLTWNAKGQKPKWLRDLEADGDKAIELPPAVAKKAS